MLPNRVAYGLEVSIFDTLDGSRQTTTIRKSAVRIGRNSLNDLHVDYAFVSQFHAVVEFDGQILVLRDNGSTNGCVIRGELVQGAATELSDGSFTILQLQFQIRPVPLDLVPQVKSSRKPLAVTGLLQAPTAELLAALEGVKETPPDPKEVEQIREFYDAYRGSWTTLLSSIQKATTSRSPADRGAFVTKLSADFPTLGSEPDFHRLAADVGSSSLTMRNSGAEERIATEGLREIAVDYIPGSPPPESAEQFVAFLTRLRETLDIFFKAFIPLREGQRQFRQDLGIPAPIQGRMDPVERASTPVELSAALLGAKSSSDAIGHIESTFADMMIHHVAMLNGVMTGVKSLLKELSPESISEAVEGNSSGVFGMSLGGPGPKQLWAEFQKRHKDISEEEKQLFKLLFGRQFSVAYTQAAASSNVEKRHQTVQVDAVRKS